MSTITSSKKRGVLETLKDYVLALTSKNDINAINIAKYNAAIDASPTISQVIGMFTNNVTDYPTGLIGGTTDPFHRIITFMSKETGQTVLNIDVMVSTNNGIDYTITGSYTTIALNGVQIPINEVVSMPREHPELTQEQILLLK